MKVKKAFLNGRNLGLIVNFGQFTCSWIWIQDSQMNADPGGSGSGYTTLIQWTGLVHEKVRHGYLICLSTGDQHYIP
jgi:hypothetical protein